MITKTGNEMVKQAMPSPITLAAIGGAALGSQRAYNLSEDQQDALRAQYNINSGSLGINLRNATRGALGALTGGGVGSMIGAMASGMADAARGNAGIPNPKTILASGILGAALGGWKATNKYSKGNADAMLARMEKIRNRQEERKAPSMQDIERKAVEYRLDGDALKGLLEYYRNNPEARAEAGI